MIVRRRSALYLPASNTRAIAKARTLPADVVILDLEDAVAPDLKAEARASAVSAIGEGGWGDRELVVRVNGRDTAWGKADLNALAAAKPAAVLIPKVRQPGDIAAARAELDGVPVWAMIETAAAVLRLDSIAAAPGVAALVVGANDLALELGCAPPPDRRGYSAHLQAVVAAARAHGIAALAPVWTGLDDAAGFAREAAEDAALGFDGKTCIHPSQIEPANAAFSPTSVQTAWARRIVEAYSAPDAAAKGAIRLDGQLIERLHLITAERILARA